jgi:hypothetical protein
MKMLLYWKYFYCSCLGQVILQDFMEATMRMYLLILNKLLCKNVVSDMKKP